MTKQKLIFYDETLKVLYSADYINNSEKSLLSTNSGEGDIAILISNDFSFYKFEIPDTSQRNLKKVIPFLIGEEVLGSIDDYFWVHDRKTQIVGLVEHEKIQAIKDNLDPSIKKLVPIQALSSSMDNLLVLFEEKAFISLRGKWFWLADRKSILNTLGLTLKKYEISKLHVWISDKKSSLPNFNVDIEEKKFSSSKELLSEFSKLVDVTNAFNFFTKIYEQKINWRSLFLRYKFYGYSALAFLGIFLLSGVIQFSYLNVSNNLLKNKIISTFQEKFPSETLESDLISQVNSLINQGQIDYSALNAISVISDGVSNSDNIVLISISFDRNRFVIEVQTNSYDQLQEYVDLINSMGLDVNLGASRRVNNFIQGEISINAI